MGRKLTSGPTYLSRAGAVVSDYPLTLAAWFYRGPTSSLTRPLLSLYDDVNNVYCSLQLNGTTDRPRAQSNNDLDGTTGGTVVTVTPGAGRWHHAAAVFAAATSRRAYLNGAAGPTNTTAVNAGWATTGVGVEPSSTPHDNVRVGHAAVWNAALTDGEVALLAAGLYPFEVRSANLVAYWPLDESVNGPAFDRNPVRGMRYTLTNSGTVVTDGPPMRRPPDPWVRRSRLWGTGGGGGEPPPAGNSPNLLLLGVG